MNIKITKRDIEVFEWLARLNYLSTTLITDFMFDGKVKVSRRRLKYLTDAGYFEWFDKVNPQVSGRAERIFYLNKRRRKEIETILQRGVTFYKPPKNPLFANHQLEIARFVLYLDSYCLKHKEYSFEYLVGSQSQTKNRSGEELPIVGRHKSSFVPDGTIILQGSKGKTLLFLEIDMGRESINGSFTKKSDLSKKFKAYMDYSNQKEFKSLSQRYNYNFIGFRVLFVTTPLRLKRIQNLCESIDSMGMIWLTTFDRINSDILFNAIWQVPCGHDAVRAIVKKGLN